MAPRGHVPEPHTIVIFVAPRGQGPTVRREGDRRDRGGVAAQRIPAAVLAEAPEVAPLEAAEVVLAGLGQVPFQHGAGVPESAGLPGMQGQAHVGGIEQAAGLIRFPGRAVGLFEGDGSLRRFPALGSLGDVFLPFRPLPLPGDERKADQEDQGDDPNCPQQDSPPPALLGSPRRASRVSPSAWTRSSSACRARSSAAARNPATASATAPASAGRSAGSNARHFLHKATSSGSAPQASSRAKQSSSLPRSACTRTDSNVSPT